MVERTADGGFAGFCFLNQIGQIVFFHRTSSTGLHGLTLTRTDHRLSDQIGWNRSSVKGLDKTSIPQDVLLS